MKKFISSIILLVVVLSCGEKPDYSTFYLPAEWEPQEALWLGWDERLYKSDSMHLILSGIIKELYNDIDIVLWVTSDSLKHAAHTFLQELQIPLKRIEVNSITADNVFWAYDFAPVFVINRQRERKAIDFNHTVFSRCMKFLSDVGANSIERAKGLQKVVKMMAIDSLMAVEKGEIHEKSWMFVESSAIDGNGKGTLLVSTPFLFRNQPTEMRDTLTKEHFEEEFRRTLGIAKVVWLTDGLAEEGGGEFFGNYYSSGANGHVNTFARFVKENIILLAWVDERDKDENPMQKATFERMIRNYKILKNSRDPEGRDFKIIRLPMPVQIIEERILDSERLKEPGAKSFFENNGFVEGDTVQFVATGSYMKFIISNEKIIIPSYINHGTSADIEKEVENIFNVLYPKKKLLFIDAAFFHNEEGDVRFMTKQVPKRIK